jgi:hypothetical protein
MISEVTFYSGREADRFFLAQMQQHLSDVGYLLLLSLSITTCSIGQICLNSWHVPVTTHS